MKDKYENLYNLPHHVSSKHPQMDSLSRAAQFAPFAALTGFDEEIEDAGIIRFDSPEQDDYRAEFLDEKLKFIESNPKSTVEIHYLSGHGNSGENGLVKVIRGTVKKIDIIEKKIIMTDDASVMLDDVFDVVILEE